MTEQRRKIVLDVDTGIDDALAILYALRAEGLDVLGITTCFGNVDVDTATANTLALVELAGRDVPVYRGSERPLLREWLGPVPWIHGENGLGNAERPVFRKQAEEQEAASFLRDIIRQYPREVTVIPVARMTNLARAFLFDPELPSLVGDVVFMGGAAFCAGNVTPSAEANVWGDPEAARIVLQSGAPITMVGLDVTMQARLYRRDLERLDDSLPYSALLREAVQFYMNAYETTQGVSAAWCPLHDPLAVALVEDRSLCETAHYAVDVSLAGITAGMTVVDARAGSDARKNAAVCTSVDTERFVTRFRQTLGIREEVCP